MRSLFVLFLVACTGPTQVAQNGERGELAGLALVDDHPVTPAGTRYVAATFSPDGERLAVSTAGYDAIDVVDTRGSGAATSRLVAGERSGYRFAWAPDGRSIVHRTADGGLAQAWLDGRRADLVASGEVVGFPAYASDGALLFSRRGSVRSLGALAETTAVANEGLVTVTAAAAPVLAGWDGERIFVADLATGEQRELFTGFGFFDVELSADGRLAVVRESRGAEGHIWVAATDGSFRRDLGVGYGPRLSPDGRSIVYVEQRNDGRQFLEADLFLTTLDGSERTRLTETAEVLEIEPSFSPDGGRLAYVDAASGRVHVATLAEVTP